MHSLDLYILGSFAFSLLMSIATGKLVWTLANRQVEKAYIEYSISPGTLKDIASEAIRSNSPMIIMPPMTTCCAGQERVIQIAFVDQKMRLEQLYEWSEDEDEDEGSDGKFLFT